MEKIVFKDIKLIKPKVFEDERRFFLEVFNTEEFKKLGIDELFVQD
ncbi:dTDP-4-dehydrorhamnose 3,5-epimerase family protein, partial [Segatella copri]